VGGGGADGDGAKRVYRSLDVERSTALDTLDADPCAAEGHHLALQPKDFGAMRGVLDEAGLPLLVLQEGGYHMERIAAAASAFWTSKTR